MAEVTDEACDTELSRGKIQRAHGGKEELPHDYYDVRSREPALSPIYKTIFKIKYYDAKSLHWFLGAKRQDLHRSRRLHCEISN